MVKAAKQARNKPAAKGQQGSSKTTGAQPKRTSKAAEATPIKRGRGRPKATPDQKASEPMQFRCTPAERAAIKRNYEASQAAADGQSEARWAINRLMA